MQTLEPCGTEDVTILAIESSCDETAAAVVRNGREVLSNIISSQIDLHTIYGGVVPEIASRKHIERIDQVIAEALQAAGKKLQEIDAVAVTYGPGLVGALLVGVSAAKAISFASGIPLIGVHHIEGHIRAIGLGYPGGPKIDRVSREGDPDAIKFPRAKVADSVYDFSFSGLKSAVLNYLNSCEMKGFPVCQADVAASFQKAVVDVLVEHSMQAMEMCGMDRFAIAGGVASNSALRRALAEACEARKIAFYHPSPGLCTDNAAMIGAAAYYEYTKGVRHGYDLNAVPNLKLGEK